MKILQITNDYVLVNRRYLWNKEHLFVYSLTTKLWYRDKLFGEGVVVVCGSEYLTNELATTIDLRIIHHSSNYIAAQPNSTLGSVH